MLPNGATGAAWRLAPGADDTLRSRGADQHCVESWPTVRVLTGLLSEVDTGVADFPAGVARVDSARDFRRDVAQSVLPSANPV